MPNVRCWGDPTITGCEINYKNDMFSNDYFLYQAFHLMLSTNITIPYTNPHVSVTH
jgi:hypothetical protein